MNERPRWNRPSLMEIVLMISVPIAGLIWFDWSAIQILLLYWCENAILGLFNVLRMVLAKPVYESQADFIAAHPWLLQHYPISEEEWKVALTRPGPREAAHKPFVIPLFIGHYTFFLWVHCFLLATLIAHIPGREWWTIFTTEWNWALAIGLVSLTITHGHRFWQEDLQGRTHTRSFPLLAMIYPYRQLLVLHLALFLGGLTLVFFSLPPAVAILLILLKAAFDLNWIRLPIGPKKIDWAKPAKPNKKSRVGIVQRRTVREQPPENRCELHDDGSKLRLILPPRGLKEVWREMRAGGCILVGLGMVGFVSIFFFAFAFGNLRRIVRGTHDYWPLLIAMTILQVLGTLWLVAFSVLLSVPITVLRYGRVRGSIELTSNHLMVEQRGVLFRRRRTFALERLEVFGMSPTGHVINEFKVVQWLVKLKNGREFGFFTGRDPNELNWIATVLRDRLKVER